MLADFNINKMNTKDDILKFIDEVSEKYKKDITKEKEVFSLKKIQKN